MNEQLKVIISAEIDKLKTGVNNAKSAISNFKSQVEKASKNIDKTFADMGAGINKALKGIGTTLAGFGAALLGTAAATEEYRNNQALLATAFETAGSSATAAKETYNDLYRVLGDGGQATEAAQHLAKLTTNEKDLAQWTNICQGVYATFGASLPIEGLTEAANETAKTGTVTGSLADALNWAGISEDSFNESLAACNTEAEREKLIRETLNGLYNEAATNYETNNAEVLAQRDAQAALQEQLALLGAAMAPILTVFTQFAGEVLTALAPHIQNLAETLLPLLQTGLEAVGNALSVAMGFLVDNWGLVLTIAGVIGAIAAAIGLYNTVAAIKAAMDAAQVTTVWGLVAAHTAQAAAVLLALAPYLLIVAAVAAVIAIFVSLWNNCEGFRNFWIGLWEGIKNVFNAFVESLKPLINAIVGAFKEAWEMIKAVWNLVKPFFQSIWNGIKSIFSVVGSILSGFFKVAWENIKIVWGVVVSYFTTIWNNIKAVFSVVKNVLTGNFKGAWDGIKQIFSNWGSFFTGLWNSIKQIFSNVGQAIGSAISNTVKTAINAVLRTAVGIINGFISAINIAISVINAIPGVNIRKLSKLEVPAMATGGVVDSATLAMIGENGKEAVVPLENNLEWLDKLAGMLNDRMGGSSAKNIVLNVDGKTFAQASIDSLNQLTRQTGSLDLVIV